MNLLFMQNGLPPYGVPRNGLILALDGYRDTYGRNIMPAGSDDFTTGWAALNSALPTIAKNQPDPDGGNNAATIQTIGGTTLTKYASSLSGTVITGIAYPMKIYIKNNNNIAMSIYHYPSATFVTIPANSNWIPVIISAPATGAYSLSMGFRCSNISDSLNITVYHPQINLGQLFDYSPPAGLPANPLDYYRNTNVQNGSAVGGDSNDIAGYTGTGWQMNTATNPDNYFKIAKGGNFDNLNYATCITIANALGAGGGNYGRIHDKASGSALTGHLSYLDANRKLTFSRYNGASNFKQWVANDAPAWSTNNVLITRFEKALNNDSVELMVNGVNQTMAVSSGGTPAIVDDANLDLFLGNRLGNDRYFNGTWYQHFWYNRILTDQESVLATKNIKSVLNARGVVING